MFTCFRKSAISRRCCNKISLRLPPTTQFGGLLVDREVRAVVGYLSQVAQWNVREHLARVKQMATMLNLDHLHEVTHLL